MSEIPAKMLEKRRELSYRFLSGEGVEVGALHHPMTMSPEARVRYVDRFDVDGLREHYPELRGYNLVPVDVIDDGEKLSTLRDGELDFLIANHFLEHTENPIGTIRNHLSKVRSGGRLYFAIPNKHNSFDRERELTTFEHLVNDDRDGPENSRLNHFREWARYVEHRTDSAEIEAQAQQLMAMSYSIHFHVWDARSFADFLDQTRMYLNDSFEVEHFSVNDTEVVAILKKRGSPSATDRSWLPRQVERLLRSFSVRRADWKGEARALRTSLSPNRSADQRRS